MVLNISVKFRENFSQTVFKLLVGHEYMTKIITDHVQRAVIQKVGKSQLWFLCSASSLMVVNISIKLSKNILNSFQVMLRTRFCNRQTDIHGKNNMSPDPEG